MKQILTILLMLVALFCFAQSKQISEVTLNELAIYEFSQQDLSDSPDYNAAYKLLAEQVGKHPEDAELRYYLGCAIDGLNNNRKPIVNSTKEKTENASEQFEKVNSLEPVYKGEIHILDPYSKLSAIWGALAYAYESRNQRDSAKWAFMEGKRRGGFLEPILEYNRQLLNSCQKNAILVVAGDNTTFPIAYLQEIEKFRTDVTMVNVDLLNESWYVHYLNASKELATGLSRTAIDTIDYELWQSKIMTIENPENKAQRISWELRSTIYDNYILKGDKILLHILQENLYRRPFYFDWGIDPNQLLFLDSFLVPVQLIFMVNTGSPHNVSGQMGRQLTMLPCNISQLDKETINKSVDAISMLNNIRIAYIKEMYALSKSNRISEAKSLLKHMNECIPEEKLPYHPEKVFKAYTKLVEILNK